MIWWIVGIVVLLLVVRFINSLIDFGFGAAEGYKESAKKKRKK